jgi:hypothetical protein
VRVQGWETVVANKVVNIEETMTTDDRWCARRLPDDFIARTGDPMSRISTLVRENWWEYDGVDRARLTEMLLPILQPLTDAEGEVPDEFRDRCVEVVDQWLAEMRTQEPE